MMKDEDPVFEGEVKVEQKIEGNIICVGICNVKVAQKIEF